MGPGRVGGRCHPLHPAIASRRLSLRGLAPRRALDRRPAAPFLCRGSLSRTPGGGESVDFSLTDEQRAIQETAREFARREVDPIVDEIDETQKFPRDVMAKAGELGFLGIIFPEEAGGAGLGYVEYVLV